MPATKQIMLNSGNIFIFPSASGLHFLITLFILFLLGTNYQNNLILFLVFFLCSFMVTSLLLSYQNLAGLKLTAVKPQAQFAGKDCLFHLRLMKLKNRGNDIHFSFQKGNSALQTVIDEEQVLLYHFSKMRGYFNPERVTVSSTFPFGLFNVWTHLDFDFKVLLYPIPLTNKLPAEQLTHNNQDESSQQFSSGIDQFSTLKNYQQGESLKSVAWKQLAQGRGMLSKQFEQSIAGERLLDISLLQHIPLEKRLSFLCYQVITLEKTGYRYGLMLVNQKVEMGSGTLHQHHCLQALALFQQAFE
ncbi:DUF58 domain-containing protein [Psychromonas hadalis]|uniref:DUF58 domain-containing protein n=1 Tax=Psychromonas hadalis TaxID=211669 RepID=UPI00040E3DF5|nr:DUF58 domain-containing protein [Psychromonas hadalis]